MGKKNAFDDRQRHRLAQECAKIMATEGVKDFAKAKRKALSRLGIASNKALLPSNLEVEQALLSYQRLFLAAEQSDQLRALRQTALDVIKRLAPFRPKLVGQVLHGTAGRYSEIELHVFPNTPEELLIFMMDQHIEYQSSERRLRLQNSQYGQFPVVQFDFNHTPVDLTIFWQRSERETPLSLVDGKPMRRAGQAEVERLLAGDPVDFEQ